MANRTNSDEGEREELPVSKAAQYLLEECRMVLPGMQALFGFQLVVVFNPGFSQKLTEPEQRLHLAAIVLLAVAIALIMTPAAYHRQTGARQATDRFLRIASRLLLSSMVPFALGICIDFYLVAHVIYNGLIIPILAVGLFALFMTLWFVFPHVRRRSHQHSRPD